MGWNSRLIDITKRPTGLITCRIISCGAVMLIQHSKKHGISNCDGGKGGSDLQRGGVLDDTPFSRAQTCPSVLYFNNHDSEREYVENIIQYN
jgi:hypothetical protein